MQKWFAKSKSVIETLVNLTEVRFLNPIQLVPPVSPLPIPLG